MSWINWKKWPYWLRGGVIGGAVATIPIALFSWCAARATGYDAIGCAAYIIPTAYPVGWLIDLFEPVFGYGWVFAETHMVIWSIPFWFLIGSLIGAFVHRIKSKKKNP